MQVNGEEDGIMSKEIVGVLDYDRYFDDVEDWLEDLECNCCCLEDAMASDAELIYEWKYTHPELPTASEIAIKCFEDGGKAPSAKDLADSMLETFYDGCDWYDGDDITGNLSLAELQRELYYFAEINQFLWLVYEHIPYSWGIAYECIAKYSLGLGRLQRALNDAERLFAGHQLQWPKKTRKVTPMDMEIYRFLPKEMRWARAVEMARKSCPDFDLLEY